MAGGPSRQFRIDVGGDVSGQFVVGNSNHVAVSPAPVPGAVADLAGLEGLIDQVRSLIAGLEGADAVAGAAKLDDLQEAIVSGEPDLATMEHVQGWFSRKMPTVARAVTGIILSPFVSHVMAAAGDDVAAEFCRRFGL